MDISAIYSSPLKRAVDTAQAIAGYHNLEVQIEPALREMEVGELEGVPITELGTNFSSFMVQWRQGEGTAKLPGGESLIELSDRVWSAVQPMIDNHKRGDVVLVSHYFVIVAIICQALGMPVTQIWRLRVQNASISILDFDGRQPSLVSMGDICHLREG
jgi:broad specificity phosphatase PhoE